MQTTAALAARIERLIARIREQSGGDVGPSHIVEAGGGIEDGGQYGDPHRDMRPEFLKEADAGYVPVATLRDGRWE